MRSVRMRSAVGVAGALFLTASCASDDDPTPRTDVTANAEALGHVHGLGVDPGDETLYAATHFGVFRVGDDGSLTRIADRRQDTMAFTVVGPGHFLGSGHPDLREDLPSHLGLIESLDAAESWSVLSLGGEADFHSLEVVGDRVYGYDATSGRLMTTTDRESWTTITKGQIVDIAVVPSRPDRVVVTTPSGAVRELSLTGTSRPLGAAPRLVWIDATSDGRLVGITADGEVFTAAGADGEWQRAGRVAGAPGALEAADTAWYAATDERIFTSTDGGTTWTVLVDAPE